MQDLVAYIIVRPISPNGTKVRERERQTLFPPKHCLSVWLYMGFLHFKH